MKRIVLIFSLLITAVSLQAQKLTVEKMEVAPMDLSASTQPRNDKIGNPCALVKVLMVDGIDRVEGNVIGDVEDRGTEKWVYLSAGTKMMKIVPKNHLPLMIIFSDYGIVKVESKVTYVLTLQKPQNDLVEEHTPIVEVGSLDVKYSPRDSEVWMDGVYLGKARKTFHNIMVGVHEVTICADGFESQKRDIEITSNRTSSLSGKLVESSVNMDDGGIDADTFLVNGVKFKMIRVDEGEFVSGDPSDNDKYSSKKTYVGSFYIGETEVTQSLWLAVMGELPRWTKWEKGRGENYPAYGVSKTECYEFINKINAITGEVFGLPTVEQWEFAARGGSKSKGYKYSGSNSIKEVAWYDKKSVSEVKLRKPNELGLYDMSGNVCEYCESFIHKEYTRIGGGSWIDTYRFCYVWSVGSTRSDFSEFFYSDAFGFRLVLKK